ncbi:MAG: hypothetical protein ACFBRM_10795 [Pikeienuella sp.]
MSEHGQATAAGIEELIARLRAEGVEAGEAEAKRRVEAAEREARRIVDAAHKEAGETIEAARKEAERLQRGGEEALRIAMRDTVLELSASLSQRFAERIRERLAALTREDETLKRMILAVARRARDEAGADAADAVTLILPRAAVGLDDLRRKPEELSAGSLSHFVATEAAEMLRAGVQYSRAEDGAGGIRMVLEDTGLVVDLSDAAVADLILAHLQPRFRALLEGVVN